MSEAMKVPGVHPQGERAQAEGGYPAAHGVDTFGGKVEVQWSEEEDLTWSGPLTYFIEFLKVSGIWERFVDACPLSYHSPNAPTKAEILGTILLSVLNGHRRYAHITGIRGDQVLAGLLGIDRFRSEDSVRRAFEKQDEFALTLWLDLQMNETYEALLESEWILDVDATVKTLYGRQEEARVGYNPGKPGRPSHVYHSMLFTAAKLVVNVDVQAGNQTASLYGQDGLWGWLGARERSQGPTLVRGDCGHGTEEMMVGCEERELPYLFKLRQSGGVKKLVEKLNRRGEAASWQGAGQGWEGISERLQLQGWSRTRRVLVLRRRLESEPGRMPGTEGAQLSLPGMVVEQGSGDWYEYTVLVTSWEEREVLAIAQLYRDRGDAENLFDELKNQWGWRGFATADLKRSQLMARLVALIFNWWSIYTRMATGRRHGEAITTRPQLQQGAARRTTHAHQTRLIMTSAHGKARKIAHLLAGISQWLKQFGRDAEQFPGESRWPRILRQIFEEFVCIPFPSVPLLRPPNCRI